MNVEHENSLGSDGFTIPSSLVLPATVHWHWIEGSPGRWVISGFESILEVPEGCEP